VAIQLNNRVIRAVLAGEGLTAPAGELCILGVRGMVPYAAPSGVWLSVAENRPDEYNDALVLFGNDLRAYLGSVDPGETFTAKPLNPQGCAHLVNGSYLYKLGFHKGHAALVQAGPVTVRRDRDRDGIPELGEPVEEGFFGLNIHAGGQGGNIGAWSAGCQLIKGDWDGAPWLDFLGRVEANSRTQRAFRYSLIEGEALVRYVDGGA
jgi:hypothetical protein